MILWRAFLAALLAVPAFSQGPCAAVRPVPTLASAPILSGRAALEFQKDADRLYASLAEVHARAKAGEPAAALLEPKRALAADLRMTIAQLPGKGAEWSSLSARLKEAREERAALESALAAAPDHAARAAESRRRAELNAEIFALQLRAVQAQLLGRAPLPSAALRRNAALWSLVGAYNSAAALGAETGWREGVARADDLFGDETAVVVSRRWRSAHAEIEAGARDARNGRQDQAAERFAALAGVLRRAPAPDAVHLERHLAAADALDAAALAARSGAQAAEVSQRGLAVKALILHPRLAEPVAISYEGLSAAARAQVHALASVKRDYLDVLARETVLARWAAVLAGPRPTKANREAARVELDQTLAWASRGFVGPKQVAAQDLAAALAALGRGDDALASRHAGWARQQLANRRADLEGIAAGLRGRLAKLSAGA